MESNVKRKTGIRPPEEPGKKNQMSGARYREELGDALHSTKDDCLKCSHKAQLEHEVAVIEPVRRIFPSSRGGDYSPIPTNRSNLQYHRQNEGALRGLLVIKLLEVFADLFFDDGPVATFLDRRLADRFR